MNRLRSLVVLAISIVAVGCSGTSVPETHDPAMEVRLREYKEKVATMSPSDISGMSKRRKQGLTFIYEDIAEAKAEGDDEEVKRKEKMAAEAEARVKIEEEALERLNKD